MAGQKENEAPPGSDESLHALADELLPLFYEDLRRIGRRERRRVGAGATLPLS